MKCEIKDCDKDATTQGRLEEEEHHLCFDHGKETGFCAGCGEFWGGTDEWEFPNAHRCIEGYCQNCSDEIKSDCGEYDDETEQNF